MISTYGFYHSTENGDFASGKRIDFKATGVDSTSNIRYRHYAERLVSWSGIGVDCCFPLEPSRKTVSRKLASFRHGKSFTDFKQRFRRMQ